MTSHQSPAPQAILNAMRRMVYERTQWDEAPELGCFYRAADDAVHASPIPIHPAVWHQAEHPKNILHSLIQVLAVPADDSQLKFSEALRDSAPDGLCGAYLRTEGWTIPEHRREEMSRRAKTGNVLPRFQNMPDRVELRVCSAVDADKRPYMVTQERGNPRMEAVYEGMPGGPQGLGGLIPDLLSQLTSLLITPVPKEK